MKTYRFWHQEIVEIRIAGQQAAITCYGRSNVSAEEARADALARAPRVERKIAGEALAKEDYAADIREEIVCEIDAHNVITRNRYGALVLNTESLTILDIDQHRKSFLEALGFRERDNKAAILEDLEKLAARPEYASLGFRVYETLKGMRAIVTGAYFDPVSADGRALLERTHSDPLFAKLCVKQKCYRARLTPKPQRIKQKAIRYRWPMDAETLASARQWVREYESRSQEFATCHYARTLGKQHAVTEIISIHDEETRARSRLALA